MGKELGAAARERGAAEAGRCMGAEPRMESPICSPPPEAQLRGI